MITTSVVHALIKTPNNYHRTTGRFTDYNRDYIERNKRTPYTHTHTYTHTRTHAQNRYTRTQHHAHTILQTRCTRTEHHVHAIFQTRQVFLRFSRDQIGEKNNTTTCPLPRVGGGARAGRDGGGCTRLLLRRIKMPPHRSLLPQSRSKSQEWPRWC